MANFFERIGNCVIRFWTSKWCGTIGALVVSVCEFAQGFYMSGLGWMFTGFFLWAWDKEQEFYDELHGLYRKHLDLCEKRDLMLEEALEKLKKYEPEDEDGSDKP